MREITLPLCPGWGSLLSAQDSPIVVARRTGFFPYMRVRPPSCARCIRHCSRGGKENFVRSYSAWAEAEGADCRRGTYLSFVGWNSVMPSWFPQTPSRRCSLNLFSPAVWSRRSISNLFLFLFWVRAAIYVPFPSLGWLWSFCGSSPKLSSIQFPKGQSQRTRESATRQTIPRERPY